MATDGANSMSSVARKARDSPTSAFACATLAAAIVVGSIFESGTIATRRCSFPFCSTSIAVFSLSTMTCLSFAPATASSATAWVPSASAIVKFEATVPTTRERSKFFSGSAYLNSNDARPLVSPSTAAAAFADAFARPASSLARAASSYVSPSPALARRAATCRGRGGVGW